MKYKLTVVQGELVDSDGVLQDGENLIGRSHSCAIRVTAPDVSGKHCKVVLTGDTAAIENLSQSGSLLDGEPLEFITLMEVGQVVAMGEETALRLELLEPEIEAGDTAPVDDEALSDGASSSALTEETALAEEVPEVPASLPPEEPPTMAPPEESVAAEEAPASEEPPTMPPPAEPEADEEDELPTGDPGLEADEPPTAPPPPIDVAVEDDDEEIKTMDYEDAVTRALETRALRPEDLAALREAERARPRRQLMIMAGGVIALLVAAFIFWPKAPPPETEVTWPQDANGNYLDGEAHGSLGPLDKEGFSIGFPATKGWKKTDTANGFTIDTRVGRDRTIPLIFNYEEEEHARFVSLSLDQLARDWMSQLLENEDGWTFDEPSPQNFIGKENGIPYLTVSYSLSGAKSWYGMARIFQVGARRFILRSDIPYPERIRAKGMVNLTYIRVSKELERRCWAGHPEQSSLSAQQLVRRIRPELDRMAPATWVGLVDNLQRACRKAYLSGDQESLADAESLLVRLRESQAIWFNAQKIARMHSASLRDEAQIRQITDLCKGVFSSTEDYRYMVVRREFW